MNFWEELFANIASTLSKEIKGLQTCAFYPVIRTTIGAPALLLEVASFDFGTPPGTGEVALRAHFEARVVVDSTIKDAQVLIIGLISQVIQVVHLNSWALNISPAEVLNARPDGFKSELDAYLVWCIEWVHEIHQGTNIWAPATIPPHTIYIGHEA